MKQTMQSERIILQLSINREKWEQWKKSNLSLQTTSEENEVVPSPKSASG